jgi:hypothetical protein
MKLKNPAAKIGTVGLSAVVFASLWGWIASRAPVDTEEGAVVGAGPTSVTQRVYIVRTQNADGTVSERIVPEAEALAVQRTVTAAQSAPAPQPVARSRGS